MGGIAGILQSDPGNPVSSTALELMSDVMRHRGPNRCALYLAGPLGLVERRLGLPTPNEPLRLSRNEDQTVWVALDGQITNSSALRTHLSSRGHALTVTGDGTPIPHLYETDGVEFVQQLRGFFSIALWDARSRLLLLARDRLGVKPLYYWPQPHALLFGSELKCLFSVCHTKPPIDLQALNRYLSLGFVPDPDTIWEGARKLPPGCLLVARDGQVSLRSYWQLPQPDGQGLGNERDLVERLREVTRESLRSCLPEDSNVGVFLSGGVDSSTLAALASRLMNRPVKTFTLGYNEKDFCEFPYARKVAAHIGAEHHELLIGPDALGLIQRLVECFDEPFGDSSAIPTYLVSEQAHRLVSVVLTGEGNDEIFAGCERYLRTQHRTFLDSIPRPLRRALLPLSRKLSWEVPGKNYLYHASLDNGLERYMDDVMVPLPVKQELLTPEFAAQVGNLDASDALRRWLPLQSSMSLLDQIIYIDTKAHIPGDLLTKVDRMTMAHSLDARMPFLDHLYVEFVSRLPIHLKLRGDTSKVLFRQAFGDLLPSETLNRSKMGFAVPLRHWFAGVCQYLLRDTLLAPRAQQRGYFKRDCIARLIDEHVRRRRNHSALLWRLLILELWHQQPQVAPPKAEAA